LQSTSPDSLGEEVVEKKLEDRAVLVVLRQGTATPHRDADGPPTKEIVTGVASWNRSPSETLELFSADKVLVAEFRDWSFVKFLEPKNGS
jgi:hypothetical protein